jgi:4-amino-4-deoxy-L-arabinose transferase-like glycosyltransferase
MMTPSLAICPWWKHPIFWIMCVALMLRVGSAIANHHEMRWQNDARMSVPAVRLLEGKGLSLEDDAGPTAYRPPLYILWLSGMYALFGHYAEFGPSLIQALASTASVFLLYLLTQRLFKREDVALASAALLTIHPYVVYHDAALYHTWLSTMLLLGALFFLIDGYERRAAKPLIAAGALFGLCILTTSVIVPFLGLLILAGIFLWRIPLQQRFTLVASLVLGLAITWGPWMIRNAFVFHAFVPLTTESGVTLWMGNNPESATRLPLRTHESSPVPQGTRFNLPSYYTGCVPEGWCEGGITEQEENRELTMMATNWIKQHPKDFATLTLWRMKGIWSPFLTPAKTIGSHPFISTLITYGYLLWNLLLAALILLGIHAAWREKKQFYVIASMLLALTATGSYALFLYYTKYRIPFEMLLLPLAGLGFVACMRLIKTKIMTAS